MPREQSTEDPVIGNEHEEEDSPPEVPKRKNKPKRQNSSEEENVVELEDSLRAATLSKINKDTQIIKNKSLSSGIDADQNPILLLTPDTVIGKSVVLKGELTFDKLLRIDGRFEGELQSRGSLIVGASGIIIGDVIG